MDEEVTEELKRFTMQETARGFSLQYYRIYDVIGFGKENHFASRLEVGHIFKHLMHLVSPFSLSLAKL